METLALILARGGSKGIPDKNMRRLAEKPLIEYTINAAKSSRLINRIIVSTDDCKIAKFAKSKNIEVPFLRPKKYSQSKSKTIDVINHAINFLQTHDEYSPNIVTILQPTSPLRTSIDIDKSIKLLKNSKNTSCVLGVTKIKTHPYLSFESKNGFLIPFKSNFEKYFQRQKFPTFYYPTGSIYTLWTKTLSKYHSIYGPKLKPMFIDVENSIDIDTPYDLFQAEMKYNNWNTFIKKYRKRSN